MSAELDFAKLITAAQPQPRGMTVFLPVLCDEDRHVGASLLDQIAQDGGKEAHNQPYRQGYQVRSLNSQQKSKETASMCFQ